MKNREVHKKDIAWWVYLILLIAFSIYGFWNSAAAEILLRVIKEAFSLLIE